MTRKREVLAKEDISDLPPPSHRHPMSDEPIWDQHAVRALLSKLRAPVADERAAFEWWASDEGEYPASVERDGNGNYKLAQIQAHWDAWQARAALASAPVAGEARPTDRQEALRITELPDVDEALATFCSDGTQDNAVGLVLAILGSSPQASPVSEEAVYTLRVRGAIQAWTPTVAAFSIPDGEHQLFLSPAAPQASAEEAHQDRRDTLLSVLGKLNSNPYNLTKAECTDVVREMFNEADKAIKSTPAPTAAKSVAASLPDVMCDKCGLRVISTCGASGCPIPNNYARAALAAPSQEPKP
ncbi:hypothetical protein [Bordetella bronchiseptica]|uniref:hypothetical protein n=1 Tax=Bordetella bronchiseptica TaxID=518 RepID=UPI000F6DA57A|nr:hypothetical protein [Bordetella bronchiseptica]VEI25138.1 Uncharacterised protein [Bordetella bronchiseptica]